MGSFVKPALVSAGGILPCPLDLAARRSHQRFHESAVDRRLIGRQRGAAVGHERRHSGRVSRAASAVSILHGYQNSVFPSGAARDDALRIIRLRVAHPGFHTRVGTLVTTRGLCRASIPATPSAPSTGSAGTWSCIFSPDQDADGPQCPALPEPGDDRGGTPDPPHAYHRLRVLMQRSAHAQQVPLGRISFRAPLDTARHFAEVIHAATKTTRKQQALIEEMLTPHRHDPSHPRAPRPFRTQSHEAQTVERSTADKTQARNGQRRAPQPPQS